MPAPPRSTSPSRRPRGRRLATCGALGLAWLLLVNCSGSGELRHDPLRAVTAPLSSDAHLALAARYAPWIYHEVHPDYGRQDLPTRVDFDGDLLGANNWDHLADFELPPTVYYAVLETETHWFLSYHLFHPRDWSYLRIGFNETHENDGENLQVVVSKASGRPVLLFTQAHFFGAVHADPDAGFRAGEESLRAPLLTLDARGVPSPAGTHAGVFVEGYGHGIYGALDPSLELEVGADGSPRFPGAGLVFRPAAPGEAVAEPDPSASGAVVPYRLASTEATLWPGLADGSLIGEGGLLDGPSRLEREVIQLDVPRFYEADRFSGLFGSDRGISPFAVCFSFWSDQIGALYFDPANRYPEVLGVPEPWSRTYVAYPYRSPSAPR
ncbi:MAG: hypothetical protein KDD82_09615 [Planctomycetes bacterium]|nr:hypothetical protein [Planctomycetota bacterium]